jgi:nitrous oxide reductase accessory protein NosL
MKKLFSVVALLAVVGTILLAGCKPADDTSSPPAPKDTNAPAAK